MQNPSQVDLKKTVHLPQTPFFDEGEPGATGAEAARALGSEATFMTAFGRRKGQANLPTSFTTALPTPTATFIWAMRSISC